MKNILVTGGSGFIGTNLIRLLHTTHPQWSLFNLDALTYAGNPHNHSALENTPRYTFIHGDITQAGFVDQLFETHEFDGVFHLAAESHVDRSIAGPRAFMETNVTGTFNLLEAALRQFKKNPDRPFRFLHVSTDEVYGSLNPGEPPFTEETPYDPSSPYSASKAASDHFAKSFHKTFGLPVVVTNCSNNYGPYQFPEKLIPLVILNILDRNPIPVYGKGENIRDWLYVKDHCRALALAFEKGRAGQTYNIGGGVEKTNIQVVHTLCDLMDERQGNPAGQSRALIRFVTDRPGHDLRYAINADKSRKTIGYTAEYGFETAMARTIDWYLEHMDWVRSVQTGKYREWMASHYSM